MNRLPIVLIWLAAGVADAIVLPVLIGAPGGFGVVIFLIALVLTFGVRRWVIGWGIAAAFISEIIFGLYFGALIGSWLAIVWSWYGLNRFLTLKSSSNNDSWLKLIPLSLLGTVLFAEAQIIQWLIIRVAYDRTLVFLTTWEIISMPGIILVAVAELAVLLAVLRYISAQRQSGYVN